MILRVDTGSPVPPYEQMRAQIETMITAGVIEEGTRLPAIRQLATDLELAVGTVARAYRELERQGLIATRGRHGTFVQAPPSAHPVPEKALDDAAREFALRARHLGADASAALGSLRRALEALPSNDG